MSEASLFLRIILFMLYFEALFYRGLPSLLLILCTFSQGQDILDYCCFQALNFPFFKEFGSAHYPLCSKFQREILFISLKFQSAI